MDGTLRRIARIEISALNNDLPTHNSVRRIDVHNFRNSTHKAVHDTGNHCPRRTYEALLYLSLWYNSPPEQEGKGHYQRSRQHSGLKTKSTAAHRKAVHSTNTSRPDRYP